MTDLQQLEPRSRDSDKAASYRVWERSAYGESDARRVRAEFVISSRHRRDASST